MANRLYAESLLRTHEKMLAQRWHKTSRRPYVPVATTNTREDPYILFFDTEFISRWDVESWGERLAHDAITIHEHMEKHDIDDDWDEDLLDQMLPDLVCKDAWVKEWPVLVERSRPYPTTPQGAIQCLFVRFP